MPRRCLPGVDFTRVPRLLQAPARARLASPSNEGSLSYTVGDLKERLRALRLPLHGRKAELLERLKAALAADTAASPPADEAERQPQPAAAAEEQPHTAVAGGKRRKVAPVRKRRQAAAEAQATDTAAVDEPEAAAAGRKKRVQPGTAALGPVATAKVIPCSLCLVWHVLRFAVPAHVQTNSTRPTVLRTSCRMLRWRSSTLAKAATLSTLLCMTSRH